MKKIIVLAALFVTVAAGNARAGRNLIDLHGSFYDFNDSNAHTIFNPGYEVGMGYQRFVDDNISLAVSVHYMNADSKNLTYVRGISCVSAYLEAYYHVFPDRRLSPYFGAGVGYLYSETVNAETSRGYVDNSTAYLFTAGMSYQLTGGLYLEVQTQYSLAHVMSQVSVREIDVGGLATGVGLQYRF